MWSLFGACVIVALLVDFLALRKQGAHRVSIREAAIWSAIWVAVSFVFVAWIWWYLGGTGDFIVVILLAVVLLVRPAGLLGKKA